MGGRAAGDADEDTFFGGEAAGHFHRFFARDLFHLVDDAEVEGVGNKPGTDALNLVRSGFEFLAGAFLGDDRAFLRLDGDGLDFLALGVFDVARNTGDGAAGADARDEHVDRAVGVIPDFRTGGLFVNRGVCRILELLGHEIFGRVAVGDFFRLFDRALHAFGAGGQHEGRAKRGQYAAAFDAHRLGHGQGEFVPAGRRDIRERDAGVAGGRFDNFRAGFQHAAFLGIPDHRSADAALDGVCGIAAFDFRQHPGLGALGDMIELNQRGAADGLGIVGKYFAHDVYLSNLW